MVLVACTAERPARERLTVNLRWDTAWIASPEKGYPIFQPTSLAATDTMVFVLDFSEKSVWALRAYYGKMLWRVGRRGPGPGEFVQPAFLRPGLGGDLVVLDQSSRRVTTFGSDGRLKSSVSLVRAQGLPEGFCTLPDGKHLVGLMGREQVVELDADAQMMRATSTPWGVVDRTGYTNQTLLVNDDRTGSCVAAFLRGIGFARYSPAGFAQVHPYVEHLQLPVLLKSASGGDSLSVDVIAVWDAALHRDTLWVLFGGQSPMRRRMLDLYDASGGKYLKTFILPERAVTFTVLDNLVVLKVEQADKSHAVLAIRR